MSSSSSRKGTVIAKQEESRQHLSTSRIVFTEFVPEQDSLSPSFQRRFSNVNVYDLQEGKFDEESEATVSVCSRGSTVSESCDRNSAHLRHSAREAFLHPVEVERLIPSFNGKEGGCSRWINKIEGYAVVYGWSPRARLHYAHSRLTGTARKWFEAQDETTLDWESFKTSICEAFPSCMNEADVHFKLAKRFRDEDEDEECYVYEMQRIAKEGRLSEEAVIAYIVRNVNDDKIQEYLMSKDLHQVKELICCLQRYLRMRAVVNTKPYVQNDAVKHQVSQNNERNEYSVAEDDEKQPPVRRCFNCNEKGHLSAKCPLPQKKLRCTICGRVGHPEKECSNATGIAPEPTSESSQIRYLQNEDRREDAVIEA